MSKQDGFSWNEYTYQELEDIILRNPDYFKVECLDEDCYLDLQYIDVIKSIESYHLEDQCYTVSREKDKNLSIETI